MYETLFNEYEGDFGKGRTVDEIVDWVEDLPPMPDVITRALRLVDDPNTMPDELAEVIMLDPTLVSPVLRIANSAGLGQRQEVTTLTGAIQVVGMRKVKSILMASAVRRWNRTFGPVEELVWQKSIGTAAAAHALCDHLHKRYRDELYLTGVLHNLGQIVFLSHKEIGALYPQVLDRMRENGEDYAMAEREVIGFSHPLVGALVARKWGFPMGTCQAILHYCEPFEGIGSADDEKLAMLKIAANVGMELGYGRPDGYNPDVQPEVVSLAPLVGFDSANLENDLLTAKDAARSRFTSDVNAYA